MTTLASCICGFTELADETLADHLLLAFEPQDRKGLDGLVHEEHGKLACACGFTAITPSELDSHFLRSFTPLNAIGSDGRQHGAVDGA